MKQLYFLSLFLISALTFAQDVRLYENTWYLSYFTQNATSVYAPVNEEVQNVPLTFNSESLSSGTTVCNYIAGNAEFTINGDVFWFKDYIMSLIFCNSFDNQTFENLYFDFFTHHYPNDIFSYAITEFNDVLTLTLTSQNGEIAVYNNHLLAAKKFDQNTFSIQPNPASDVIDLKFEQAAFGNRTVEIYNATGAKCKTASALSDIEQIPVADLASGLYIVVVKTDRETYTGKFLKK